MPDVQITPPILSAEPVSSDISLEIKETPDANTVTEAIEPAPLNQGEGSLPERFRAQLLPTVPAK